MTAKHRTPEYIRNAALRRQQVKAVHRMGDTYPCWRGGGPIRPGQPFDVGHRHEHGGEGLDNLAAEHRHAQLGCCDGNRSHGGRVGARITNARRAPAAEEAQSWPL